MVKGKKILKAEAGIRSFLGLVLMVVLLFSCSKKVNHFAYSDVRNYRFDNKISAVDSQVVKMIEPYKSSLDLKMNEVIGYNEAEMIKGKPSSTLTNWVADAIKNSYELKSGKKLDVVLQNFGGIRINSVAAGEITMGKAYEIMPFENAFVVIMATGVQTKEIFNRVAKHGGWPMSGSATMVIKDSSFVSLVINGQPFDENRTYAIGLPDYVANGGDDFGFLKAAQREDSGMLVRDMIIDEIRRSKRIKANNEQRITIVK